MPSGRATYRVVRAAVVIALGLSVMIALIKTRPEAEQFEHEDGGLLVRTVEMRPSPHTFTIHANGTVEPKREVTLVGEVTGTLISRAPQLREGAAFNSGELLFVIDRREYELGVLRFEAFVEQLKAEEAQLRQERENLERIARLSRRDLEIARREHDRLERLLKQGTASPSDAERTEKALLASQLAVLELENQLALFPSREAFLKARVESARVDLADARLRLDRTEIRAPFAGWVLDLDAEVGQYVNAGAILARIWDTSLVEIPVNLTVEEARWLVPEGAGTAAPWLMGYIQEKEEVPPWASRVKITYSIGARTFSWDGYVRGFRGRMDQRTRTFPLTVEVPDPVSSYLPGEHPPLVPGMFVRLEITGRTLDEVYTIPRMALHPGNRLWIVEEGRLQPRGVQVLRLADRMAYVVPLDGVDAEKAGIEPMQAGDLAVVSPLGEPFPGLKARIIPDDPKPGDSGGPSAW